MYRSVLLCKLQFLLIFDKFCNLSLLYCGWALESHVHETTYGPLIDTALYVMLLMRANFITLASGRGLVPGNLNFFGPQMALPKLHDAITQFLKKSRFQGPNPLPLALVMDLPASKALCTGPYKSWVHK